MTGLSCSSAKQLSRFSAAVATAFCLSAVGATEVAAQDNNLGIAPVPATAGNQLTAEYVNKIPADGSLIAPVMGFDEVIELALANNPDINMALSREKQAEFQVKQGRAYKYGEVDLTGQIGPEYNDPSANQDRIVDTTPGRNVTLRLTKLLYDGGVAKSELRRRQEVERSTMLETRIITEDVINDAVEFYSSVLQFQLARREAEGFITEMQSLTKKLDLMHDAGAASKVELDFARARLASARAETGNTIASLNEALSNLEFLTGDLPPFMAMSPFDVEDLDLPALDTYLEDGYRDNSELMLNRTNRSAENYRVRSERAKFRPQFNFELRGNVIADEGGHGISRGNYEAKLNLNYLIFDGFSRRNAVNRAEARLNELQYEESRLLKELDRRIKLSFNQISAQQITLSATRDEIASNKELQRLNRKNLELGEINIIELIDVEERLFNAQADEHRIKSEIYRSYFELLIDSGRVKELINASQGNFIFTPGEG
ncbi:MAG: TolC family protein [Pseudomonadales bacterium]